jgi:MoaA/NifB/PqqE/SkfB family radical SAM enzyme
MYKRIVRRLAYHIGWPGLGPRQVIADITDHCFFRCVTCDKWKSSNSSEEMSTQDWLDILQRLFDWLGSYHLSISGGEPLCRDDICQIVAFARDHAITTNLMTNGWLVDANMARALVNAGLNNLTFSLNSFESETHDRTRGVVGSHARVVAGIDHAKEARTAGRANMTVSLNVIVTAATVAEMPALVRWAWQIGLNAVGLQPLMDVALYQPYVCQPERAETSVSPELKAKDVETEKVSISELRLGDQRKIVEAIEELAALKKQRAPILNSARQLRMLGAYLREQKSAPAMRCTVGHDSLLIDPYGHARLCYRMEPIGDIRDEQPAILWTSPVATRVRTRIRACRQGCSLLNCNYRPSLSERVGELWQRLTVPRAQA